MMGGTVEPLIKVPQVPQVRGAWARQCTLHTGPTRSVQELSPGASEGRPPTWSSLQAAARRAVSCPRGGRFSGSRAKSARAEHSSRRRPFSSHQPPPGKVRFAGIKHARAALYSWCTNTRHAHLRAPSALAHTRSGVKQICADDTGVSRTARSPSGIRDRVVPQVVPACRATRFTFGLS